MICRKIGKLLKRTTFDLEYKLVNKRKYNQNIYVEKNDLAR